MSINLTPVVLNNAFTVNLQSIPFDTIAWVEFLNESPQTLTTQMGGYNFQIPAWYDYPVEIHHTINGIWTSLNGSQDPINISPMLIPSTLSSNISNTLLITLYQKGQYPAIQVPTPLFRQGWVPNTVNNIGGTALNVQDDNRAVGNSTVEATPTGYLSSAVLLLNQGVLYLGANVASEDGEIHVLDNNGSAFNAVIIGGLGTFPIGLIVNALAAQASNDLGLQVPSNQRIRFDVNSVHKAQVTGNGFELLDGSFLFLSVNATQALSNNSTITLSGSYIRVSNTGAITGIIMTQGSAEGQTVFLYNQGTGTLTFAAAGSNVRQGNNVIIPTGSTLVMIYDGSSWSTSRYV